MNLEPYRPDVQKYIKYYTDQVEGKNRNRKTLQIGGTSVGSRRTNKQYFVISPSEQVVKQAQAILDSSDSVKKTAKRKTTSRGSNRGRGKRQKKTQLG
jgi:hypothetical protein